MFNNDWTVEAMALMIVFLCFWVVVLSRTIESLEKQLRVKTIFTGKQKGIQSEETN